MNNHKIKAIVKIKGNANYPMIKGIASLMPHHNGTLIRIQLMGLPSLHKNNYFGLHIHEKGRCMPLHGKQPFSEAMAHYNPENDLHPQHAGDLGNLYSNQGICQMSLFTQRFSVQDVLDKALIIHLHHDDLSHDSSGHAQERIACGKILRF